MKIKWKAADVSMPVKYRIDKSSEGRFSVEEPIVMLDGSILNFQDDMLKMVIEKGARAGDLIEAEMDIFDLLRDNIFTAQIIEISPAFANHETAVLKLASMRDASREKFSAHFSGLRARGKKSDKRIWSRTETFLNVKYGIVAREGDTVDPEALECRDSLPFYGRILDISEGGLKFFADINGAIKIGDVIEVKSDIPNISGDQHFFLKVVADRGSAKTSELLGCTFLRIKKTLRDLIIEHVAGKNS